MDTRRLPSAPKTVPKVPAYPSQQPQYERIGADTALEICWNTIQDEKMQEVARSMTTAVVGSQRGPLLWAVRYAEAFANE